MATLTFWFILICLMGIVSGKVTFMFVILCAMAICVGEAIFTTLEWLVKKAKFSDAIVILAVTVIGMKQMFSSEIFLLNFKANQELAISTLLVISISFLLTRYSFVLRKMRAKRV